MARVSRIGRATFVPQGDQFLLGCGRSLRLCGWCRSDHFKIVEKTSIHLRRFRTSAGIRQEVGKGIRGASQCDGRPAAMIPSHKEGIIPDP